MPGSLRQRRPTPPWPQCRHWCADLHAGRETHAALPPATHCVLPQVVRLWHAVGRLLAVHAAGGAAAPRAAVALSVPHLAPRAHLCGHRHRGLPGERRGCDGRRCCAERGAAAALPALRQRTPHAHHTITGPPCPPAPPQVCIIVFLPEQLSGGVGIKNLILIVFANFGAASFLVQVRVRVCLGCCCALLVHTLHCALRSSAQINQSMYERPAHVLPFRTPPQVLLYAFRSSLTARRIVDLAYRWVAAAQPRAGWGCGCASL